MKPASTTDARLVRAFFLAAQHRRRRHFAARIKAIAGRAERFRPGFACAV
jgi:hypothetical protein